MNSNELHRPLLRIALGTGLLLLLPAVAMQFTTEVAWGPLDFFAAGALLFGAGAAIVVGGRKLKTASHRAALAGAIGLVVALIWAELAVGLFH